MSGRRIVVIGGGFGGAAAARTARSLLGIEHSVALVDRQRRTYLCGSFPLLIVGERETAKVSRSLGQLANRGINFVQAEVDAIDVESKTVSTTSGVLEFDYLVVALGASYDWGAVPGSQGAYSFYDIDNAQRLRRKLRSFRKGRVAIAVSSLPYKCPPAPFEAAMVMDWAFKQRGVRNNVEIHVYTPEPVPLPVAGPEAGVFASSGGETVGHNIAAAVNGGETVRFPGVGHCYIAYSGNRAGLVRGEFLAEGKPRVELSRPSARGGRSKERFERDWRRFRI
jgi:sulfide:quinone oxidoreductase